MIKALLTLAVLLVVAVVVRTNPSPLQKTTTSFPDMKEIMIFEEGCVRQGGICMRIEDCDPRMIVNLPGLCPMQEHLGAKCCYY